MPNSTVDTGCGGSWHSSSRRQTGQVDAEDHRAPIQARRSWTTFKQKKCMFFALLASLAWWSHPFIIQFLPDGFILGDFQNLNPLTADVTFSRQWYHQSVRTLDFLSKSQECKLAKMSAPLTLERDFENETVLIFQIQFFFQLREDLE